MVASVLCTSIFRTVKCRKWPRIKPYWHTQGRSSKIQIREWVFAFWSSWCCHPSFFSEIISKDSGYYPEATRTCNSSMVHAIQPWTSLAPQRPYSRCISVEVGLWLLTMFGLFKDIMIMICAIRRSTISESARVTSLRVGALRNTFQLLMARLTCILVNTTKSDPAAFGKSK